MSIEQTDKVDFISLRKGTNYVILTISDHIDWKDTNSHLLLLQNKLNTYLSFCESRGANQIFGYRKSVY